MSKDELRPAVDVTSDVILADVRGGLKDVAAIIEADRAEVARLTEQRVVDGVVGWLRNTPDGDCVEAEAFAKLIEAGEWKQ